MGLRAQPTLWSVLVMAVIVGIVSIVDLAQEVKHQFDATLERSAYFEGAAVNAVSRALNREPSRAVPIPQALKADPDLSGELLTIMTASKSLLEIAVTDPQNIILIDSEPGQVGRKFASYPDFGPLVKSSLMDKMRVLLSESQNYQLSQALGVGGTAP